MLAGPKREDAGIGGQEKEKDDGRRTCGGRWTVASWGVEYPDRQRWRTYCMLELTGLKPTVSGKKMGPLLLTLVKCVGMVQYLTS